MLLLFLNNFSAFLVQCIEIVCRDRPWCLGIDLLRCWVMEGASCRLRGGGGISKAPCCEEEHRISPDRGREWMEGEKSGDCLEAMVAPYPCSCIVTLRLSMCIFRALLGELQREVFCMKSLLMSCFCRRNCSNHCTEGNNAGSSQLKMNVRSQVFCLSCAGMKWEMFNM